MDRSIYLPTLSHWEYGNPWSGERGMARYFITSDKQQLTVQLWRGHLCRELAQVEDRSTFPVSQEGLAQLHDWLVEKVALLNET